MNHPFRFLVVMLVVTLVAGTAVAYAQEAITINPPFAFKAGATTYQAGKYELSITNEQTILMVNGPKAGSSVAVVTRLSDAEPPATEGKVIFDKVGDLYYLSEVWIPGFDGFLVNAIKEKHTHVKVKPTKKG
jgi:hypothetical protein